MATTTTNFGWDIPQSTDLVKDGATAIAALGQDIDTAFVDLKGGTTGQVLAKASNTDLDYTWTTPEVGDITAVTAGTGLTGGGTSGAVSLAFDQANYGGGQFAAGKNKLLNADFGIWQRGTGSFAANSYSADRWVSISDATVATTQQSFTLGAAPVSGYEGTFFQRTAKSAGGTFVIQEQRVEDVRIFAAQTVTLSFWAKADATVTTAPVIVQFFGTGGSASVDTTLATATITTSWARYSMTVSIPSISGKTIGAGSYLGVRPIRVLSSSATTIDLWGVQLEYGSKMTPFQTASGGSPQAELAMCQRYYTRYTVATTYGMLPPKGYAVSGTTIYADARFVTTMRTAPTAVEYGGNIRVVSTTDVGTAITNYTLGGASVNNNAGSIVVASGLTTGGTYQMQANNDATAYVAFTAEL